jgi:hypothetical protein
VVALFERLRSIFGTAWSLRVATQQDYDRALHDYGNMLQRLTVEQIKAALPACWDLKHPPSPAEFYQLAKALTPRHEHKTFKALPRPKPDADIVAARIANLREALHGQDAAQ